MMMKFFSKQPITLEPLKPFILLIEILMRTATPPKNLTPQEQWIEEHASEFVSIPHFYNQKPSSRAERKQLNLRMFSEDLIKLKAQAAKLGMPYQTYIISELHKLANREE